MSREYDRKLRIMGGYIIIINLNSNNPEFPITVEIRILPNRVPIPWDPGDPRDPVDRGPFEFRGFSNYISSEEKLVLIVDRSID